MSSILDNIHVVDGNMKQLMMPFVQDPRNPLYSETDYTASTQMKPAFFSFRQNEKTGSDSQRLNFCPYSYKQYFDRDIGNRLLYQAPAGSLEPITYQKYLNNVPAIQIREFIPDTMLDQCVNILRDLTHNLLDSIDTVKDIVSDINAYNKGVADLDGKNNVSGKNIFHDIYPGIEQAVFYVINYLRGGGETSSGSFAINDFLTGNSAEAQFGAYNINQDNVKAILQLPFMFYYRLQSCTTTGIYEVPYIYDSNAKMYNSNGSPGWDGDGFRSGFRLADVFEKAGGLGSLVNMMFGNIGISWTPWWDPKTGQATPFEDLQLTFDLYNDNAQAALTNFLFVNNLVASNKWVQYGLAQHSPHIYDVKIEGQQRMYACSGQFSVNPVGVMRDPPKSWVELLCNNHANTNVVDANTMVNNIINNKLIKIPDVYKVTMQFHSLLPDNFNQFIFQYAGNINHIDAYKKVYEKSGVVDGLGTVLNGLISNAREGFVAGSEKAANEYGVANFSKAKTKIQKALEFKNGQNQNNPANAAAEESAGPSE